MKYLYDYVKELKKWPLPEAIYDKQVQKQFDLLSAVGRFGEDAFACYLKNQLKKQHKESVDAQSQRHLMWHAGHMTAEVMDHLYSICGDTPELYFYGKMEHSLLGYFTYEELEKIIHEELDEHMIIKQLTGCAIVNGVYDARLSRRIYDMHWGDAYALKDIVMLARDTKVYDASGADSHIPYYWKSVRALRAAHDRQAAKAAAEQATKLKGTYEYTDTLKGIVAATPFRLPASPLEIWNRGQEQHNCLANYIRWHEGEAVAGYRTLILMGEACSIELEIKFADDSRCSSARVLQCRGKYNKNFYDEYEWHWNDVLKDLHLDVFKVRKV